MVNVDVDILAVAYMSVRRKVAWQVGRKVGK